MFDNLIEAKTDLTAFAIGIVDWHNQRALNIICQRLRSGEKHDEFLDIVTAKERSFEDGESVIDGQQIYEIPDVTASICCRGSSAILVGVHIANSRAVANPWVVVGSCASRLVSQSSQLEHEPGDGLPDCRALTLKADSMKMRMIFIIPGGNVAFQQMKITTSTRMSEELNMNS